MKSRPATTRHSVREMLGRLNSRLHVGLGCMALLLFMPMAVDAATLLVASQGTNQILKYDDTSGAYLGLFANTQNSPSSIKVGPDGNVYVANFGTSGFGSNDGKIQRFDLTGTLVPFSSGNSILAGDTVLGLAFAPDGFLYYSTRSELHRADNSTGVVDGTYTVTGLDSFGQNTARDIELVSSTQIAASQFSAVTVRDFSNGSNVTNYTTGLPGNYLTGLAFDDGRLYVGDYFGSQVLRTGVNGTTFSTFASTGLSFPVRMIFDGANNMYVSASNGVFKYDSTGTLIGSGALVAPGAGSGGLDTAYGIAFLPVPEPSGFFLSAMGIALFVGFKKRWRIANA